MAYSSIVKPTDYFNTVLYTGNGSTNHAITGVGFQPDWSWIKQRSGAEWNILIDSVRGVTKYINSNDAGAERTSSNFIESFDSDGFTLGSANDTNQSSQTYASWNWLGANGTASNSDGSITSTVSANTTAGFSIVSFTGTGSNATIGHGLGAVPKFYVVKDRDAGNDWFVYHGANTSAPETDYLKLNSTAATADLNTLWNDTAPTSSVFSLGTNGNVNTSSNTYIAYCFAEKKGYSKFGSYTGNGTSGVDGAGDGTFVYTGFKPSMIIIKPSSAVENWQILDNKRPGFNESDNLAPNNSAAENTSNDFVDLVSNGFKLRSGTYSASGVTYIYMAFAENPFVANDSGTAVPVVAR
jgi:hypothetical protein